MALELKSLPEDIELPENFTCQIVDNESRLKQWCLVTTQVFEFPDSTYRPWYDLYRSISKIHNSPCKNYIGLLDGEVVAASSVFYGAGVAGIYSVATIESARKKGIGLAMTAIPLLESKTLGYQVSTLHSSIDGYNVYRKLGYKEYCTITNYISSYD
jgi:predicted GNAT family acetyltransferase